MFGDYTCCLQQEEVAEANDGSGDDANDNVQQTVGNENQTPSTFRVALTFFITFFTSLVPQQPGAVNAN